MGKLKRFDGNVSGEKKLKKLKQIILENSGNENAVCKVIFRGDYKTHIAEISVCIRMDEDRISGYSWMQGEAPDVITRAEQFLMDFGEDWDSQDENYSGHAECNLRESLIE